MFLKRFIITLGGVGYLPASGTFASLLTCLILWPILTHSPTAESQNTIAAAGTLLFSILSIWLGPAATAHFGKKDPSPFVLDEAAGICLSLLFLPYAAGAHLVVKLTCVFIAFRIFDITKPPPARQLEYLPQGWGILMDDLAAAVYANLLCQVVLRFFAM